MPTKRSTTKPDLTPPKTEVVTVRDVIEGHLVLCSQDYIASADIGHYRVMIEKDGHLVDVFRSTGAVPDGKVGKQTLAEHFRQYKRNRDQ